MSECSIISRDQGQGATNNGVHVLPYAEAGLTGCRTRRRRVRADVDIRFAIVLACEANQPMRFVTVCALSGFSVTIETLFDMS